MTTADKEQSQCRRWPSASSASCAAISSPLAIALFMVVAAVGLAGDLMSKHHVFETMLNDPAFQKQVHYIRLSNPDALLTTEDVLHELRPRRQILPGVRFTLSTNPGVVFGLPMPRWAVAAATVTAIALVLVAFATTDARAKSVVLALAMILAGALGNLYDRLFCRIAVADMEPINYQVRDFIDFSELYYPYVFNVADVLLVVGAALWILHRCIHRPAKAPAKA